MTSLGAYAFGIEPAYRLRIQRYAPVLPRWPEDLALTIAVIADPHVGEPYMSVRRLEEIVAVTNNLRPDLILLLGDYAAGHHFVTRPVSMRECAGAFRALKSPLGTFAILGNHDWWDDRSAQRSRRGPVIARTELEAAGIPVLENDAVRLVKDGRPFWLLGLGDQLALLGKPIRGVDDLRGTLAKLTDDAPAILMAHEPDIFPLVPRRIALTLSGHTHGGQVRFFGYSPLVPSSYGNRYAYGHIEEHGRHLIVSGGLGTSIMPVRFGVPPEIVHLSLGTASPAAGA
ncbi:metallophosphoesterase [Microvirga sp. WGZ8]|uniref:Metallophosphoesterase n=1 Tax=Microvirga puerhi TaxID=2876078 RepID=A0ABS7VLD5_9HYPH|nr:metallophosphoesterase [Microvirga puerhi]MBZ6076354.1 metallophosphoesterase [Microvirga puerhi]